ncbi:hypothetical protein CKAN_01957300 [Cinnamomum micranthum f. kanehirae]|uniref:Uncharacterized protein n=1 Tax=Cinnamomum micranthum f. kanehirae TaxID=337451 RepID=A0A3S3QU20_9MAGN|nr:hypothetical protein CKAN_01957300 [Cinnamomum micranthum f. kanehirae]
MAEVNTNIGGKRRLPVWMLGVTAADQLRKSKHRDENITLLEEQSTIQAARPKAKPVTRRLEHQVSATEKAASEVDLGTLVHTNKAKRCNGDREIALGQAAKKKQKLTKYGTENREEIEVNVLVNENGAPEMNSSTLIRCDKRRTVKKGKRKEDYATNSSDVDAQTKKAKMRCAEEKRAARKHTSRKKQKLKDYGNQSSEDISSSPTEGSEDEDLTMEDLMSMAEEYVKASEKNCQQTTIEEPKSRSQFQNTAIISKNGSGGSLQVAGIVQEMSTCTTTGSSPNLVGSEREERESLESGVTITTSRTGDPAQDMLELLLGPLLKKPQAGERTLDTLRKDMAIACNFGEDISSQAGVEQEVPLTKKKSSLKDKVAMFLE